MSDNLPPPEMPPMPVLQGVEDRITVWLQMQDYARSYAAAAVLAERERCAKVCEELERESGYAGKELEQAAAAIRKG